ncbi:MAG: pilus assembly protein PilY [Gammaproteobacteria bacterium]|nr:pilus assembly protein PilY [Gammaproteobacteria bacterium]
MNHQRLQAKTPGVLRRLALVLAGTAAIAVLGSVATAGPPVPMVVISDIPLVLVEPTHPQVLVVVPNSQSMDGDLSGAIMTGSGIVGALNGSSSPVNYTVPVGFAPPVQSAVAGQAAYTVKIGSTLYDNSASRLNVAKQAIGLVLQQYAANFDFGLMVYNTGTPGRYHTWVYYMSAPGGFTFGDRLIDPLPAGATEWVANPCYGSVAGYCSSVNGQFAGDITLEPDMAVAATTDEPDINDVLYAGGSLSTVCLVYGNHSPPTPFPPYRTLSDYNNGSITVSYTSDTGSCARSTAPTNAGFVPYSDQVMYAERGFGYYTNQSATRGDLLVPVAPASTGATPTPAELNAYIAQFTPHLAPQTDDTGTGEIKALAIQAPIAGLMRWARKYFTTGVEGFPVPPSNTGCPCNKYVVMLTDGLPTEDYSGDLWPPLGTASANGYGVHATFNLEGGGTIADTAPGFTAAVLAGQTTTIASTNDQAVLDAISQIATAEAAGIQTYIVGMGAGVDPNKNPAAAATMKAMAIAGGTGDYFAGVTPQDVVNDLQIIFAQIQAANQSTTTVAVNSTSFQTNTNVYQARFDTSTYGWTGDLVAYDLLADGTVDQTSAGIVWDARDLMDSDYSGTLWNSNRIAVTINSGSGNAVAFRWSNLSTAQQTALEAHWGTLTPSQQAAFSNDPDNYGKAVLDYLRGDQSRTQASGGIFRNRDYLLGDIVNSAPLYVAAPHAPYPGTSYAAFAIAKASRTPVIYVGANDGALHAFNADTGHELFAFFPLATFDRLAGLSLPSYDSNHKFFVDGSPNAGDIKMASDSDWHTILVGGLNSGGKGIYAMDVTDPSGFTGESAVASNVLWTITDNTSGFTHLGLTYSQPQIVRIDCNGTNCNASDPTYAVIFGSGYNNDNAMPYLYVVNAETGALIHSFDLCSAATAGTCNATLPNGLSTPVTVSSTGSAVTDRVYAGDLQGHLWRVNLSDPSPSNWKVKVLFTARNAASDIQQITTQPAVSFAPPAAGGGIMVYFGTGQFLGAPDVTDTRVQSFYGVLDRNSVSGLPLARSDLADYTLAQTTIAGIDVRTITGGTGTDVNGNVIWSSKRGWKMNLPLSGERSITDPLVIGGRVVFTTFTPSTAVCSAGGVSWLMILNYAGGAMPGPELDINGDENLGSGDQTGSGQNPVGVSLGSGYAAAPTLIGYHQGQFNDIKLITVSGKPIKSIKERGLPRGVLSWSEIR